MISRKNLILGIDLGTTSVKTVLLESENREIIQAYSKDTNANVNSDIGALGSEQDVGVILKVLQQCVQSLDQEKIQKVSLIGVSGQMHGCMLWKRKTWTRNEFGTIVTTPSKHSRLYTWQDSRCTKEFLVSLPTPESHLRLSTGHGCATLFWLQRHRPEFVQNFDRAGTLMDYLVATLCDLDLPVMSVQNAASWGYFNTTSNKWNTQRLSSSGFPVHLLPMVKYPGCIAGQLHTDWLGAIPSGTMVGIAMGDLPCSMLSSLKKPDDAVVNIGTSAQIVTRTPQGFVPPPSDEESPDEYFPYFGERYLNVAASLNGGNVIAAFIDMLHEWLTQLGCEVTKHSLYDKVVSAGIQLTDTDLVIKPTLHGERHQPDLRASVENVMTNNLSMGHVARALCHGVIANLHSMYPREKLLREGVSRVVGCGSALMRNQILREELERVFGFPVLYNQGGDAAMGAALAMALYPDNQQT